MGKLRTGPVSYLTKASTGAETDRLNFYATSYSANYGKDGFIPRKTKCRGTGYLANFRPGVYYSHTLDKLDNVYLGNLLRDNYVSFYNKQHRPYHGAYGNEELPTRVIRRGSGFTKSTIKNTANTEAVYRTRAFTIEDDERHKPYLHKLQRKRVPHLDAGSMNLETETNICYKGIPSQRMVTHLKDVGTMQPSGFTHYHHEDPIQYLPKAPYGGEISYRYTEIPQHKAKYIQWPLLSGKEMNATVCKQANRASGYTYQTSPPQQAVGYKGYTKIHQLPPPVAQRTLKNDPSEFVNLTRGERKFTLNQAWYKGDPPPQLPEHNGIGRQELSGFSKNHGFYVDRRRDKDDFVTVYDQKYNFPQNIDRWRNWGDTPKPSNGFTKATVVQKYGDGITFRPRQMESYHPMVARKIKNENPCYNDNTVVDKTRK